MQALLRVSAVVDAVNRFIGRNVSWLILVTVLISAVNAIVRKAFDMSSNAWLEAQWYLYGTVFMLAAAYTLLSNEHIRIDVVSSGWSKRTRDWIDLVCHVVMLLPFCLLMVYLCWPWFLRAFLSGEISANAGGLPIWPAKFVVFLGFLLLTVQAMSEIIKRYAIIRGIIDDPAPRHDLPPEVEAEIDMMGDRK